MTKEFLMSPVITIGIAIAIGMVSIGGLVFFLKSEKPAIKWGGLLAFGTGLFLFLLGIPFGGLTPPP